MFGKWFGRFRGRSVNGEGNQPPRQNEETKIKAETKKSRKKPPPFVETVKKELPEIGDFTNGVDHYGNVENPSIDANIKANLLEDLATYEKALFLKVFSFLSVPETVGASIVSKNVKLGLRNCPLRMDSLTRVIRMNFVEAMYKPVLFPDGVQAPHWELTGIICGLNDLNELFKVVDPKSLLQLGVSAKDLRDIRPVEACENLEKIEFHVCPNLVDISPLTQLKKLKIVILLKLDGLVDISPLAGIVSMTNLSLWKCENIADISPLATCTQLKRVGITQNEKITNYTPLQNLTHLEVLDLSENPNLLTLDCMPDIDTLQHLYLSKCTGLANIEWLRNHSSNLKLLKMNDCKEVDDLSALENAFELLSLTLTEMKKVNSLADLYFPKLRFLLIDSCPLLDQAESFLRSLRSVEAVILKECVMFGKDDAIALLSCPHIFVFECASMRPEFLAVLLTDKSIVMRRAAKEAIVQRLQGSQMAVGQMHESVILVDSIVDSINFKSKNKAERDANREVLAQLQELALNIRNIATGLIKSRSFPVLLEAVDRAEDGVPLKLQTKILTLLSAAFQCDTLSADLLLKDLDLLNFFIKQIQGGRTHELKEGERAGELVYNDRSAIAVNIVSILLANLRKALFETAPLNATDGDLRVKLDPLKLLDAMQGAVALIEGSGVIKDLLEIVDLNYPSKDHQGPAFRVFNNLTLLIRLYNQVRTHKAEMRIMNNAEFELRQLDVPSILIDDGVPLVLKAMPDMEIGVKITASGWLIQLLEEGGEEAKQKLLEEVGSVMQILQDVFIFSVSAMVTRVKDNSEFPLDTITLLINTGADLIRLMPKEIYYKLLDPNNKIESVRVMVHLIEFHIDILGDLIRTENIPPALFQRFEQLVDPNKGIYIKHVNTVLDALMTIAEDEKACEMLVKTSEKIPGVVASLLHIASDELGLFDKAVNVLIHLCEKSVPFRNKLQYLYTNSDATVALKLFMDPEPGQRPRIPKTLAQKKRGLDLLLILLESQNFRTKFLDYNGKELASFVVQFKRFVVEVEAISGRDNIPSLEVTGKIIGRLLTAESNTPPKVRKIVARYILPMVEDLAVIETDAKVKELQKLEESVLELEENALKPKSERTGYQNTFQAIFQHFIQLPVMEPKPKVKDAKSLAEHLFGVGDEGILIEPSGANEAATNQAVQIPTTLAIRSKQQTFNWAFRISMFLSCIFEEGGGFAAAAALDNNVIKTISRLLKDSKTFLRGIPPTDPVYEDLVHRVALIEAATSKLLAALLQQFLDPHGRIIAKVVSADLQAEPENEDDFNLEEVAPQTARANIFAGIWQQGNERAKEQLEAQKRAAAMEVRALLNKQRQLDYVKKLAEELANESAGSFENAKRKSLSERKTETKLSRKAMKRIDAVWNILTAANTGLDSLIDRCMTLLQTSPLDFGVVSAFSFITVICRVSLIKEKNLVLDLMEQHDEIFQIVEQNVVVLEKSGGFVGNFLLLLVDANLELAYQVLASLLSDFTEYNLKTNTPEGAEKRLCISLLLVKLLRHSQAGKKITEILITDWVLPAKLAEYLPKASEDAAEVVVSFNVIIAISLLCANDPERLLNLIDANDDYGFPEFLVSALRDETLKAEDNHSIGSVAMNILSAVFDHKVDYSEASSKTLGVLGEKMLDAGLLELLSCWKNIKGERKTLKNLNEWEKNTGLIVVELAVASGKVQALEADKDTIIPILIDMLFDNPSPQLASTIVKVDPGFSEGKSELLFKELSRFEEFNRALEKENKVLEHQKSDGDIVMTRIRGLPHEVSTTSKYKLTFKKVKSTVAVIHEDEVNRAAFEGKVYFEVQILKDRLSLLEFTSEPKGSVGIVGREFKSGPFAGSLSEGVGENSQSFGLEIGDEVSHMDVVGVIVDLAKEKLVFRLNGRKKAIKGASTDALKEVLKDGFFPAVSGQNLEADVNLGQKPFKFAPSGRKWISFNNFMKA